MVAADILPIDEIRKVMDEVVELFLIPRFHELGMPATGDWEKAVGGEAYPGKGIIMGLDYTEQLVHGQGPTTVPLPDLKRWAKAKFRLNDNAAASVAERVQRKIQRSGTTWYEQGGSDLLEVLEEQDTLNYIYSKLGTAAQIRISQQLIRQFEV